jgi:CAAX prenyl protease-like protein
MCVTSGGRAVEGRTHGWWPYVVPYFGFLLTVEVARRLPDDLALVGLLLKPCVPGVAMIWFAWQGAYPELRKPRFQGGFLLADVALGVALAALWMVPYVYIPAIRPDDLSGFDPEVLGASLVGTTLALRMLGYGLVTPFFEEIFIRSLVMRYSEVFRSSRDFRSVPLAHFSRVSFVSTVVMFTVGHVPWEWWVAVPWVVLTNLWFYFRKDLYAVIVVHAATNASMLAFVAATSGSFTGPDGQPFSLWFFI